MGDDARIMTCPDCGARNRLRAADDGETPRCGMCGKALAEALPVGQPFEVDDESFPDLVLGATGWLLLDCWAAWCQPCRMTTPIVRDLARDHADRLRVAALDTEHNRYTAGKLELSGIPTFILYKDGVEVTRLVGAVKRERFDETLRAAGVIDS